MPTLTLVNNLEPGWRCPREGERERERERERDGGPMKEGDVEMSPADSGEAELDDMKKRLKEMEDEAAALREMQAKVEREMGSVQDPANAAASQANKEEIDSRSIFVGNVDYSCTPEEVQQHFQSCGTVNRVTIRTDKYGQPKGYAYVEFLEPEAVQEALLLNESELHGRQLKVQKFCFGCLLFYAFYLWFWGGGRFLQKQDTHGCTTNSECHYSQPLLLGS
ncbi:hypothetical protein EUGRSUZ_I02641 [Eucalyptus grandis]|uniref:RRM domain-containing protein n=2 Tax=Eucalyptus grandis TaxID=71139 RepID=A0A059ATK0_EUCGR|nr:hypothetical protein EUGRSUZ_I02641 [Eucalyptus grandis]